MEPTDQVPKAKSEALKHQALPLMLRDLHCTNLIPSDQPWPAEWAHPLKGIAYDFNGNRFGARSTAGSLKSSVCSGLARARALFPPTPSSGSSSKRQSSLGEGGSVRPVSRKRSYDGESVADGLKRARAILPPTPLSKSSKSRPTSSKVLAASSSIPSSKFCSVYTVASPSCRRRPHRAVTPRLNSEKGVEYTWVCLVKECHLRLEATSQRQLSSRRTTHLVRRHGGGKWDPLTSIRQCAATSSAFTFKATDWLPADQRSWNCPWCSAGLPTLARFDKLAAVKDHLGECHPGKTATDCYKRRQKTDPLLAANRKSNGVKIRNTFDSRRARGEDVYGKLGHTSVAVEPVWSEWAGSIEGRAKRAGAFVSCSKCYKTRGSLTGNECSGKPSTPARAQASKMWGMLRERGATNPSLLAHAWGTSVQALDKYYDWPKLKSS